MPRCPSEQPACGPRRRSLQAHYILDEMIMNGCMVETNRVKILTPVQLLDKIEAVG